MADEKTVIADENSGSKQDENQTTEPDDTTVNVDNMIPKSRFDQVNQAKKDAIAALKEVADSLAEDVPDDMRSLIPELAPAEKITWIRQAMKKGIFTKQVESGPGSKRPGGKQKLDLSQMKPEQMMSAGYNK